MSQELDIPGGVYRGTSIPTLEVGDAVELDAFTSTSWSPQLARAFARGGITTGPYGDTIIQFRGDPQLRGIVTNEIEQEVILAPGQQFRVVDKKNDVHIEFEEEDPMQVRQYLVMERIDENASVQESAGDGQWLRI